LATLVAAGFAPAGVVVAQSTTGVPTSVIGQVTILERPGETSEDLGNVVVFLEPAGAQTRGRSLAPTDAAIALQSRQFSPRVRVVTQGSTVRFRNEDPFNHNVFSKTNGGFDTGVYGRGKTREAMFDEAGVYSLYCNVHPRMTAFVVTVSTPFFVQAGADGRFRLDSVPPGQYRLHVWHDRATEVVQDLTVPTRGASNLRVELDARAYKYVQHKNKYGQDYTSTSGDRY
jgi:plastocyanin